MSKHFVVVGAGVGGLGVAMRLAHRGHRVTVLEKTDAVGGRNRREQVGDCRFDGGPTLLMMLDPFKKLFKDVGEDFDVRVPNRLCDPSYRVFFADGTRFDGTTNVPVMTERIREMSGDKEAAKWLDDALDRIVALTEDDTGKPEVCMYDEDGPPSTSQARVEAFGEAIWAVYDLRQLWKSMGPRVETVRKATEPGRNDPCHCGSGKKYKKCTERESTTRLRPKRMRLSGPSQEGVQWLSFC